MTLRILALAAVLSIAACTWPKKLSDIGTTDTVAHPGPYYPIGLERRDPREYGLYYSEIEHDAMCCWLAPKANIEATKSGPASQALLTILVPAFAFYTKEGQTVTIVLDGKSLTTHLDPGLHTIAIDLSPHLQRYNGPVPIAVRSERVFVPAHEGVNTDERALGVVLVGVVFH
jgi:hypothetical protein